MVTFWQNLAPFESCGSRISNASKRTDITKPVDHAWRLLPGNNIRNQCCFSISGTEYVSLFHFLCRRSTDSQLEAPAYRINDSTAVHRLSRCAETQRPTLPIAWSARTDTAPGNVLGWVHSDTTSNAFLLFTEYLTPAQLIVSVYAHSPTCWPRLHVHYSVAPLRPARHVKLLIHMLEHSLQRSRGHMNSLQPCIPNGPALW